MADQRSEGSTWRRRLMNLARRLGLEISGAAPGVVVVSRSARFTAKIVTPDRTIVLRRSKRRQARIVTLDPGLSLLADGSDRNTVSSSRLGPQSWLIDRAQTAKATSSVVALDEAGWLVSPPSDGEQLKSRVRMTDREWLVGIGEPTLDVAPISETAWLVTMPDASPRAEPLLETHTMNLLGERHIAWLLDRHRIDCVLDVGANIGQYAMSLRHHGYRGHIASFEPVPQFADQAERAAAADPNWTVHRIALGSSTGTVPIRVQRSFSSMLDASAYGRERFVTLREFANSAQIDVPLFRLDEILEEILAPVLATGVHTPRIYLKMDTQGFDVEVFKGLGARMDDVIAMQSEVALLPIYDGMPGMVESLAVYGQAGFDVTGMYPVTREPDGRVIEYDCTLVRADASEHQSEGSTVGEFLH